MKDEGPEKLLIFSCKICICKGIEIVLSGQVSVSQLFLQFQF